MRIKNNEGNGAMIHIEIVTQKKIKNDALSDWFKSVETLWNKDILETLSKNMAVSVEDNAGITIITLRNDTLKTGRSILYEIKKGQLDLLDFTERKRCDEDNSTKQTG